LSFSKSESEPQDFSNVARTNSGLSTYAGPWTQIEVKHLLRRVMFGAPKADVNHFVNLGFAASISELLNVPNTQQSPPVWSYAANYMDAAVAQGSTWMYAQNDNQATGLKKRSLLASGLRICELSGGLSKRHHSRSFGT